MIDYAAARFNMIESQIRPNRVGDERIVGAMGELPRELFVPKARRGIAYVDEDLHVGEGRYLLEPMVFARLLQLAEIGADDFVLDIGCATGYSAAVLARLAGAVVAVESERAFVESAGATLVALSIDNVVLVEGPLVAGHPSQAPYDVIVLEGAVEELPEPLTDQLADGGRLVAVVRGRDGVGRATLFVKSGEVLSRRAVFDASTPLLPGFARVPSFVF